LIGNCKDILLSNILLQDRYDSFKSMKQNERKIYLYDILELNSLSDEVEHSNYKLEYAKNDERNKICQNKIDNVDKKEIEEELKKNIEILKNNKNLMNEYESKKDELYEKTQELNIELGLNKNYEKMLKDKCLIETKIRDKQKELDILLNEIKEYDEEEQDILKEKINELMKNKKNEYRIDITFEEYKKQKEKLEIEYDKIEISEYEDKKMRFEKIEEEYKINYDMKNKNMNIIDYELKNIKSYGNETKDVLLKMREELYVDNLENDIIELEIKTNIKEEYEKYIEQKIELNKKEELLKELERYEYNPECEICCKNEKVKDLKKLSEEIKELKIILNDEMEERMIEYKNNEKKLISKKEELKKINKINSGIKYLELLENKELEEERWKNNNVKKEKERVEDEIKELERNKKIKDKLEQKIKELKEKEEIIKENELIKENNKLLDIEIKEKEKVLEKVLRIDGIKEKILKYTEILNKECMEGKILNTKEIEERIVYNNKEYKLYEKEINNKSLENYHVEKRILEIEKEIVEFDKNLIEYYESLDMKIKYEYLVKITHNDGLKLYILNKYLEPIEKGINNIINNFMDKKVKLYIDDRKNKGYIRFEINIMDENIDKKIKNVDILGGRETLMVELALRLVLSQISLKPKPNFLIIDERFSVLDFNNINNIDMIFNFLNTYYEHTIVMSHIEIIKDYVKNKIYVVNEKKYSKLIKN